MSDEGRTFVIEHSPYKGPTYFVHYMLGDLENATNEHRLFIGDATLAKRLRMSTKTVQRAKAQMVLDKYIVVVLGSGRGNLTEYEFQFPGKVDSQSSSRPRKVDSPDLKVDNGENAPLIELKNNTTREGSDPLRGFSTHFWPAYPARDGKKLGKGKCEVIWRRLSLDDRHAAHRGAKNYAASLAVSGIKAKDPERWLRDRCWEDWQEMARADDDGPSEMEIANGDRSIWNTVPQ